MTDSARLGEHLPPNSLLIGELLTSMLRVYALHRHCNHEQAKQSCVFHRFPPFFGWFYEIIRCGRTEGKRKGSCLGRSRAEGPWYERRTVRIWGPRKTMSALFRGTFSWLLDVRLAYTEDFHRPAEPLEDELSARFDVRPACDCATDVGINQD